MGFGAALALGLVQGFTKNIQDEQKNRELDRTKIDNFDTLMMNAALEGKLHPQNATILGAAIRDARGELDDKERISIFGKKTTPIDFDVTELAPFLHYNDPNAKKKNDKFKTVLHAGDDEFGVYSNFIESPNPNSARVFLAEVGSNMSNPQFQKMIANNKDMYQLIHNNAYSAISVINGAHQDRQSKATEGATFPMPTFNEPGLQNFMNFGTEMFNTPSLKDVNAETVQKGLSEVTGEDFDSVLIMPDGAAGIKLDTDNKKQALQIMSSQLKIPVEKLPQFFADTFFEDAAQFGGSNKYVLVDGMINLGEAFLDQNVEIKALDPDKGLRRLDESLAASYYETIVENAGGSESSFAEQVYILAPYMSSSKKQTTNMIGFANTSSGLPRESYVMKKATQFKTFGEMEDAYINIQLTNDQLAAFRKIRAGLDAPTAYLDVKKAFKFVFSGEGFVAAAVKDMGFTGIFEGKVDPERKLGAGEKYVDEDYMNSLNANVEKVRQEKGESYAELEALRITLAFQMARAADPSGRLSNQDIEQQLVKLGTSFDTKEMALEKIDIISKEFQLTEDRLSVLVNYGKGTDVIDTKGQAIIDSAIAVNHMRMQRDRMNYLGMNQPARTQSYTEMERVPSRQYQGAFIVLNAAGIPLREEGKNVLVDQDGNRLSPDQLVPLSETSAATESETTVTLPDGKQAEVEPEVKEEQEAPPPPAEGALDATKEEATGGNNSTGWTLKNRQGKWKYDSVTKTFVPFQQAS
jgi:hypothetical protein